MARDFTLAGYLGNNYFMKPCRFLKIQGCSGAILPGSDPQEQLEALQAITNDIIAEGKLVEDLRSVGGDLLGKFTLLVSFLALLLKLSRNRL